MKNSLSKDLQVKVLKPLPKQLISFYGFIAVLIVLIPEWIADFTLNVSDLASEDTEIFNDLGWKQNPELLLAPMNFRELRELALTLKIHGYSNETKKSLTVRLLKHFQQKF